MRDIRSDLEERANIIQEQLKTSWAVFKSSRLLDVQWCKPALLVKVKHLAGSKTLRHGTVRGFTQP